MKKILSIVLFVIPCVWCHGQVVTFDLVYTGGDIETVHGYSGEAKPRWGDFVHLTLPNEDNRELLGAEGDIWTDDMGTLYFRIEENKLPTSQEYMLWTDMGWFPILKLKQRGDKLIIKFDLDYQPKATGVDLQILQGADAILAEPENWKAEDVGDCEDDKHQEQYSLYCALSVTSHSLIGDFNEGSAAMNLIYRLADGSGDGYMNLAAFNAMASYDIVKALLAEAISDLEATLE